MHFALTAIYQTKQRKGAENDVTPIVGVTSGTPGIAKNPNHEENRAVAFKPHLNVTANCSDVKFLGTACKQIWKNTNSVAKEADGGSSKQRAQLN